MGQPPLAPTPQRGSSASRMQAKSCPAAEPPSPYRASTGSSQPSAPASRPISGFSSGDTVRLKGLLNAAHLNGTVGMIQSFDEDAHRWYVELSSGETKAVRAENIEVLGPGRVRAPSPSRGASPSRGGLLPQRPSSAST